MKEFTTFEIKKRLHCDTVVIGGGTTGIAAAIASARNGAKTMLVEKCGYPGGASTVVPCWMGFHAPTGEPVVKGIALEMLEKLQTKGGATPIYPDPICGSMAAINTHWWKIVASEQIEQAGIELLLHTGFAGMETANRKITGVYLWSGEGLIYVTCKVVIDCTDTGVVALRAGENMIRGRESDGKVQVASWVFEVDGIDFKKLFDYFVCFPDDLRPFELDDAEGHIRNILSQQAFVTGAFGRLVKKAERDGMKLPRNNMPGVMFPEAGKFVTVASRVEDVDPLNVQAYSKAENEGASQAGVWIEFLRKYVPGFKHCNLSCTYGMIGVRETNHLIGEYVLTADDLLSGRVFEDSIALGGYHLDIHSPDHGGIETRQPLVYTIPYRSLLPMKTNNLLVAGRAISATHEAQSSTRVIPIGMAEGEAAGIAAAMCVKQNFIPRKINIVELQEKLVNAGAIIFSSSNKCKSASIPAAAKQKEITGK
jgi:hypothetical protein